MSQYVQPSRPFTKSFSLDLRLSSSEFVLMTRLIYRFALLTLISVTPLPAYSGVFNLPHFISPGAFTLGLEPELILTSGAGIGINFKYTHGISDLLNATAIIGTGSGPHRFRAGGNIAFDLFPDAEGQPGIGIALQGLYLRLKDNGQFQLTTIPYLHKAFMSPGGEFEPYLALPFGIGFKTGEDAALSTIVLGSLFKTTEKWRYVLELGVAINNTDSYVSGGLVYYY